MDPTKGNDPPNGSQGTPPPEGDSEGKEAPKYVTLDQFNEGVNRAISGRFKEFEKKRVTADEGLVTKFDELISQKFEAFKPLLAPPAPSDKGGDKGKSKDKDEPALPAIEEHPQFKAMQQRLDDLTRRNAADEAKRKTQFVQSRAIELDSTTRAMLTDRGIPPHLAKRAAAELIKVHDRVRFPSEEIGAQPVWRNDDGDLIPAEEGLTSWIDSEEAKIYLPAKTIAGSGQSPQSGGAPGGKGGAPKSGISLHEHFARRQSDG